MNDMIKVSIARDMAKVRRTGLTNMLDRIAVSEIMETIDCYDSAEYIFKHEKDYTELLQLSREY